MEGLFSIQRTAFFKKSRSAMVALTRILRRSKLRYHQRRIGLYKRNVNIDHAEELFMSAIVQNAGYGNTEITKISNWFGLSYLTFQSYMPILESLSHCCPV